MNIVRRPLYYSQDVNAVTAAAVVSRDGDDTASA